MAIEKSAETRRRLVEAALRLFRTEGFAATTMRRIASEAGVSPSNAYYYFDGKDELVHELYLTIQRDHRDLTMPRLVQGAPLADNLRTVLRAGLEVMEPYHSFGTTFVQTALPSSSSASPFSRESGEARALAIGLMDHVVSASSTRASRRVAEQLPTVLWLVYLGVTLHWVVDDSPGRRRSEVLADGVAGLVGRAAALSRIPGARGLVDDSLALIAHLTPSTDRKPS